MQKWGQRQAQLHVGRLCLLLRLTALVFLAQQRLALLRAQPLLMSCHTKAGAHQRET